jgi:hypothetical protein
LKRKKMAKSTAILGSDGEVAARVPGVVGVNPCGSQVLVELLTAQEALGTILQIDSAASVNGAPQGYVLALGPKVASDWGFKVGDRVTLHGNYTPLPEGQKLDRKNPNRPWILVEPIQIKAVFVEE